MNQDKFRLSEYQKAIDESNIVSKTDINGIITFVNDEFCKISGYSRDELIGKNHNIIRHPDVKKEIFKKLWDTILDKKVYKGLIKNRAKNGQAFYLSATIIPILNANYEIEEFVAIRHDITTIVKLNERLVKTKKELKNLNDNLEKIIAEQTQELQKINENLKQTIADEIKKNEEKTKFLFQQSRLASMGEMIANIAHQWRQPLNELSINLFALKQHSNAENLDEFNKIYDHSKCIIKNMSKTIEDFTNFFKKNKSKEIFFIKDIFNNAFLLIKRSFYTENISFSLHDDTQSKICGYKGELLQVVLNLLNNAKDALISSNQTDKKISVKVKATPNNVVLCIIDNGGGIKDENLNKIFEPYFTTKHPSIGTGLGLYMSKQIIEGMGGRICAKNAKDGACFEIILKKFKGEKNE